MNENIAHVIIGQIVLETSWGTRIFGNNLFNIKGKYNGESISFVTHEQLQNGQWVQITDSFRKYSSIEESVNDYLDLLKAKWNRSYVTAFSNSSIEDFIEGLNAGKNGGYATDKSYNNKLLSVYGTIKEGMLQTDIIPIYLKCLDRKDELDQLMEKTQ